MMLPWTYCLCLLVLPVHVYAVGFTSIVMDLRPAVLSTQNTSHNGKFGIALKERFVMRLNTTIIGGEPNVYRGVKIIIYLPVKRTTRQVCEYTWYNGSQTGCKNVTSIHKITTPMQLWGNSFATTYTKESSYSVIYTKSQVTNDDENNIITYEMNTRDSQYPLAFTIERSLQSTDMDYIGVAQTLRADLLHYHLDNNGNKTTLISTVNATQEFYVIGPKVNVTSTFPVASVGLEAGDNITVTVNYEKHPDSTENPLDTSVSLSVGSRSGLKINSSTGRIVMTTTANLTAGVSQSATLTVSLEPGISLGSKVNLTYITSYKDASGRSYSASKKFVLGRVKSPQFVIPSLSKSPLTKMTYEDLFYLNFTLTLPKGTLKNVYVQADFQLLNSRTKTLNRVPAYMYLSHIGSSSSSITATPTNKQNVKSSGFIKVASTNTTATERRQYVSFTNSITGNPLNFTNAFALNATNATGIGKFRARVSYGYNPKYTLYYDSVDVVRPVVNATKTISNVATGPHEGYPKFTVTLVVIHLPESSSTAYNVEIEDSLIGLGFEKKISAYKSKKSGERDDVNLFIKDNTIGAKVSELKVGEVLTLKYEVAFTTNYSNFAVNKTTYKWPLTLDYHMSEHGVYWPYDFRHPKLKHKWMIGCVYRHDNTTTLYPLDVGWIIGMLIIGIIVGLFLVALCVLCLWCSRRRDKRVAADQSRLQRQQTTLFAYKNFETKTKIAKRRDTSHYFKMNREKESGTIVSVLIKQEKPEVNQGLQRKDINEALAIDQQLENQRLQMVIDTNMKLIQSLASRRLITVEEANSAMSVFSHKIAETDKEIKDAYQNAAQDKMAELSDKNKLELKKLDLQQKNEKAELLNELQEADVKTRARIEDLQKENHKLERNQLIHDLVINQEVEMEELRKNMTAEKRIDIQQASDKLFDSLVNSSNSRDDTESAKKILEEYTKTKGLIEAKHETEMLRQKDVLDERLQKRRRLADMQAEVMDGKKEMEDKIGNQQKKLVKTLKKENKLSKRDAQKLVSRGKKGLQLKDRKFEEQRRSKEHNLRDRLDEKRKAKLDDFANETAKEYYVLIKNCNTDHNMTTDQYVETIYNFQVDRRKQMEALEDAIDNEDANELEKLRQEHAKGTQLQVEHEFKVTVDQAKQLGVTDDDVDKLLRKYEKQRAKLGSAQMKNRAQQEEKFAEELERRRKERAEAAATAHDSAVKEKRRALAVVEELLDQQATMTDGEKDRIIREHEANLEKIQDSLALEKMRYQQKLNEKLAQKRLKQKETLDKQNLQESIELANKPDDGEASDSTIDSEEDPDLDIDPTLLDARKKKKKWYKMMMRQHKEKLDNLRGLNHSEEELEKIRAEMQIDREEKFKEQDERLATLMAQFQISKAKEMARIEEQQNAISQLKMGLMDDLSSRGVLSNEKCEQIMKMHQEQQRQLTNKLDEQRQHQENVMREKLQARMARKQSSLQAQQEANMQHELSRIPPRDNFKVMVMRAKLQQRHALEREQFQYHAQTESDQMIAELSRQFEMKKTEMVAKQELELATALAKLGKFSKKELHKVLVALFPLKPESEVQRILSEFEGSEKLQSSPEHEQLLDKTLRLKQLSNVVVNVAPKVGTFLRKLKTGVPARPTLTPAS